MSETFRTEADVMVATAGHVDDTNNYVQSELNRLHGVVDFDEKTGQWYFWEGNKKFAITITSEGIKKLAIFNRLLANRYLRNSSIIFIDEPEASLHPKAISQFMEILYKLAQGGMQIFMATHSYFVIKKIYLY